MIMKQNNRSVFDLRSEAEMRISMEKDRANEEQGRASKEVNEMRETILGKVNGFFGEGQMAIHREEVDDEDGVTGYSCFLRPSWVPEGHVGVGFYKPNIVYGKYGYGFYLRTANSFLKIGDFTMANGELTQDFVNDCVESTRLYLIALEKHNEWQTQEEAAKKSAEEKFAQAFLTSVMNGEYLQLALSQPDPSSWMLANAINVAGVLELKPQEIASLHVALTAVNDSVRQEEKFETDFRLWAEQYRQVVERNLSKLDVYEADFFNQFSFYYLRYSTAGGECDNAPTEMAVVFHEEPVDGRWASFMGGKAIPFRPLAPMGVFGPFYVAGDDLDPPVCYFNVGALGDGRCVPYHPLQNSPTIEALSVSPLPEPPSLETYGVAHHPKYTLQWKLQKFSEVAPSVRMTPNF